jgi:hypothetical protein
LSGALAIPIWESNLEEIAMQSKQPIIHRAPVVDLPVRGCQYHAGEKGEDGFLVSCGKPVKEGYSYCPEHHRRVYQRTTSLREARVVTEVAPEPTEVALPEFEREAA